MGGAPTVRGGRPGAKQACLPVPPTAGRGGHRHAGGAGGGDRCGCDETVLDPLFAAVSRPFRTVFRGLGAGFWNLGGQAEKMAKKRERTGEKWARNGLKKVGPMTDSWETHGRTGLSSVFNADAPPVAHVGPEKPS